MLQTSTLSELIFMDWKCTNRATLSSTYDQR